MGVSNDRRRRTKEKAGGACAISAPLPEAVMLIWHTHLRFYPEYASYIPRNAHASV